MTVRLLDVDWGRTGADLFFRIVSADDQVLVARTSNNVAEHPAGSGLYRVKIENFNEAWLPVRVIWDDGTDFATQTINQTLISGDGGSGGSGGGEVDDLPRALYELLLMSFVAPGRTELIDNGDGTKTRVAYARDKATWLVKHTFNKDGEWLDVEVNDDAVSEP